MEQTGMDKWRYYNTLTQHTTAIVYEFIQNAYLTKTLRLRHSCICLYTRGPYIWAIMRQANWQL